MEEEEHIPAITPVLPNIPAPQMEQLLEQAQANAQAALQIAENNKSVIVVEPTIFEQMSEKIKTLNNTSDRMTTSIGFGAAAFAYYEAFDAFVAGNPVSGWLKIGQGTFALVVGIISKDPQSIFNKTK